MRAVSGISARFLGSWRGGRAGPQGPGAAITATDGPFTEAKEVIGGFALVNAKDRAEAVEFARRYADLFEEVEVEVLKRCIDAATSIR